jgi:protein TonB
MNTATLSRFATRNASVPATGAALLFSLMLFGLMYSVIKVGQHKIAKAEALQTIDFVRLKRDSDLETLSRRKPPPPPPAQPPPPAKMKVASSGGAQTGLSGLDMPNLNLTADMGGGLAGVKGAASTMFDGEIIPMQCPPPIYPSEARRAGITGWVQVELVVAPDGSVRSAKAIDSNPRGMFEAAAVQSQQRCKFKPKIVDGVPTEQRGRRKLNFGLNKAEESAG